MLGEMSVDVNGICLDRTQTYILMIEQRQVCFVLFVFMVFCLFLDRDMSNYKSGNCTL